MPRRIAPSSLLGMPGAPKLLTTSKKTFSCTSWEWGVGNSLPHTMRLSHPSCPLGRPVPLRYDNSSSLGLPASGMTFFSAAGRVAVSSLLSAGTRRTVAQGPRRAQAGASQATHPVTKRVWACGLAAFLAPRGFSQKGFCRCFQETYPRKGPRLGPPRSRGGAGFCRFTLLPSMLTRAFPALTHQSGWMPRDAGPFVRAALDKNTGRVRSLTQACNNPYLSG